MPTQKIDYADLKKMLMDPKVKGSKIAGYLRVDPKKGGPFDMWLAPDPAKIKLTEEAKFDISLSKRWGNDALHAHRQLVFENELKTARPSENTKPLLVAEGDSWFDYPSNNPDIIERLGQDYIISNKSKYGDTTDNMVNRRNPEYIRELYDRSYDGVKGFLFSGGGNDLFDKDKDGKSVLAKLLKPYDSSQNAAWHLDHLSLDAIILKLAKDFTKIITTIRAQTRLNNIHVFFHGYDYVIPGGFREDPRNAIFRKQNRWLGGPLEKKGIIDIQLQRDIMKVIIDKFYVMLGVAANSDPLQKTHVVQLRGTLPIVTDWTDEIHPSTPGFLRISKKFKAEISKVIP